MCSLGGAAGSPVFLPPTGIGAAGRSPHEDGGTGGLPSTEVSPLQSSLPPTGIGATGRSPHEEWYWWSAEHGGPPVEINADIRNIGASTVPEDTAREFAEFLSQSEALRLPKSA